MIGIVFLFKIDSTSAAIIYSCYIILFCIAIIKNNWDFIFKPKTFSSSIFWVHYSPPLVKYIELLSGVQRLFL